MRRFALAFVLVTSWVAVAGANGRPAATSTINFEQGDPQHIATGMTFGLLVSSDGGATWHWYCEKAVGYGGMYDPDYAYSPTGALFATTFDGLKVMRDGCTFASTPPGTTFISADEMGPDAALYYAAADPADAKIYKSTNDGMSFPTSAGPGQNNDWWDSLVVAPSDPLKVYLSGYRFKKVCTAGGNIGADCIDDTGCPGSTCDAKKFFLIFRSTNGGTSFTALTQNGLTLTNNSTAAFVGIDKTNADLVYLHINLETGNSGDGIYKSTNGGVSSWTKILTKNDPFGLVFLAKSDGSLVAATQTSGAVKSAGGAGCTTESNCGWTALASPPHINCLAEHPTTHDVWACTHNYDSPGIPSDGFGIMKSTDLATWTGVLKYQDIAGPVDCPAGTAQFDQCVESYQAKPSVWCCLEQQLGITASFDCSGARDCAAQPDAPPDGSITKVNPPGCCSGTSGAGGMLLGLGTLALVLRPRRRNR